MSDNRNPSAMFHGSGAHRRPRAAAVAALLALATVLSPAAPPVRAGSTGTTGLYTPQGGAAGSGNGDYVASSSPGLDTFYRYFVEVPPGLGRLVIEIFDADVGDGGDAEGVPAEGRDRDRSGWNTTATYSLVNPAGATVTPLFTTGNTTLPAGGDDAWLAFYDSSGLAFLDTFSAASYGNNNGTFNWAANWDETNDNDNPNSGQIVITGGELRLRDNGSGGLSTIHRQANLSAAGFTGATLSFDARTQSVEGADRFRVEVSGNGGGSWNLVTQFQGTVADATFTFDITPYIATNTRIRFVNVDYSGDDTLFIDNVRISPAPLAGHWEVRVNQSAGGDAINAIGLRAHDGNSGAGGTELNVYYDSHNQYGVNPPGSGTVSRSYNFYPYITSGCSASKNDFDYDSNSGTVGSMSVTSRNGSFTQSYATGSLSTNNVWRRDTFTGWTSDTDAVGYGIWRAAVTISSYLVSGTPNGNYANLWFANFQAAANPPTANPTPNAFRVYLPTDAGSAPAKPYVEQLLRYAEAGPNPPVAGQTTRYAVTVRVVNPGAQAITFSTPSNVVTANVPGGGTVYAGSAAVGQGTIVSQPSLGGTGNVVWNPGTLAAGATAILTYRVNVTPSSAGQRVLATATPASGNGTRAQFLDHTGNASQARATYLAGPICELGVTEGLATQAVVSAFTARDEGGAVVVEWQTASEAGTAGFDLYRRDETKASGKEWVLLNDRLLLGLLHAPQGGTYRFVDEGISPRDRPTYLLAETEAAGGRRFYGPFSPAIEAGPGQRPEDGFERMPHAAHPAPAAQAVDADAADAMSFAAADAITVRAIRLTVREPGLHYVRSADIAALLGVTLQKAEKMAGAGELSLTRLGQPVPWIAAPGDGPAGREAKRADGLYFYGEPVASLYTQGTVYKLARGNASWMQVARVEPSAPAASLAADPAAAFLDTLHREEDRLPATVISPDPESDYWFWEFLQSGDPTFGVKTFTVDAPGLAPGSSPDAGSLTVGLQGATTTGVTGEHHVEVRLNGTPLGEASWEGITAETATFPVPPGLLQETGNQVEVTGILDSGVPFSVLYVDAVELTYPRSYHAHGDALRFGADGHADLSVAGFSGPSVALLDITDPARPLWVEGAARESQGAGARLRFRPATRHSRYLAAGPAGLKAPEMAPWQNAGLRSSLSADYLVLSTAELAPAAERLASLRRAQGLEARVVDMAAVADEFGAGVASPHAIRSFLAFTRSGWRKAPRYVVLAGAGTLDYRDLLGLGGNLLPPLFVQSAGGLFASDNRLADTSGDGLPEMAVGRIPATTAAELDAYVDKLAAYESGAEGDGWIGRALFLSDAPDRGANFAAASERIEAFLPAGYTPRRIDLTATPLDQARAELFQALGAGASLVNYLGHGGLDRLSGAGLLANADVPALTNAGRLPVVTAMTCTVNRFGVPGVPSLGELLVKSPDGGAVAVWSASGLSVNAEAGQLAERFYRLLAEPGTERLGDLILLSLAEFKGLGGDNSLLALYNLLGDPALRLRQAPSPPPIPSGSSGE